MGRRLRGVSTEEKLALNSRRDGTCLRWTGAHTKTGYGQLQVDGKVRAVHRLAYALAFGDLPDGLEIDHVAARGCRFRDCIEPSHLEAVTHAENIRRSAVRRYLPPLKVRRIRPEAIDEAGITSDHQDHSQKVVTND